MNLVGFSILLIFSLIEYDCIMLVALRNCKALFVISGLKLIINCRA